MQTGTVSGLRFCRRSWVFKIHFWKNIVHFWKSYICSNKLDVWETNFSFTQFNRIWNSSLWTLDWDWQRFCGQLQNHVRIANFREENRKASILSKSSYFFVVLWHGWSCKEVRWKILWVGNKKKTEQLYKVSTPCLVAHHFKKEELESVGELSKVCSQIVLKCLYLARIGRPDILWPVNKLARAVKKWTKACDKRLSRLLSYIHHTCEYKQYCYVGNTAKQCRLGLFQDSDFAGDLEDSNSTSSGTLYIFGSHTFVPISWMCKKQTSVSHSSTEADIISLDAGLRLDGIPALDLWDLILLTNLKREKNLMEW